MDSLVYLAYLLGQPLLFAAVVALFGWRYRKALAGSMAKSAATAATAMSAAAPMAFSRPASPGEGARPPLPIERIRIERAELSQESVARATDQARDATAAANRCLLIAGGSYGAAMVAIDTWAASRSWNVAVLPLVVLLASAPGAIVLLNVVLRSWRAWATAAAIYAALVTAAVLAIGWHVGAVSKVVSAAWALAELYALPGLAVMLLVRRRMRTLLIGLVPVLLYVVAGTAVLVLAADALNLPGDLGRIAQSPGLRWPGPAEAAIGALAVPASLWVFLRILRSRHRLAIVLLLAIAGIGGPVADAWLQPPFPLGPLLAAVPAGVVQCLVVWLFFKAFVVLESKHWLPSQALHFDLCWLYLAIYSAILLDAQLAAAPAAEHRGAIGLQLAGLASYFVLGRVLLRRARQARSAIAPRRLLLLRVFGAADKRERLLDTLEDTWRRVGCVDLIGATDLAMRTLGSLMLECFLLRGIDAGFLATPADVEQRLGRLRRQLEGDLRYPVNEIYCYADAWQAAVLALAPASDVVLLDLREFTRANRGCEFELTQLIWHVALTRVVVLADSTTHDDALHDVAQAAWAALPPGSPNAGAPAPRLRVLSLDRPAQLARVPEALFRAAAAPFSRPCG